MTQHRSPCDGSCGACPGGCGDSVCNCTCDFETRGDHQRNPSTDDQEG